MNLARYDTPPAVARILCRHLPKTLKCLLDPAIGSGTLLVPALKVIARQQGRVIGVDIDQKALQEAKHTLASEREVDFTLICKEFVRWSMTKAVHRDLANHFDCIMMNSPFMGKVEDWVPLDISLDNRKAAKRVSIEVAFLYRCLHLLRQGGRLLAVLPASVISSQTNKWIRDELLKNGSIEIVHELPKFCFPAVESRMYLFVYIKGSTKARIEFRNHDLASPKKMVVQRKDLEKSRRLDYSYYESRSKYKSLLQCEDLAWVQLSSLADVIRDRNDLPKEELIHTWCYKDCYWQGSRRRRRKCVLPVTPVRRNDILISRVGRRCSQTIGMARQTAVGCLMSDCVLALRPRKLVDPVNLLFVLRSTFCNIYGEALLERGSGASYVSAHDLNELSIPLLLAKAYPNEYATYRSSCAVNDSTTMQAIEKSIGTQLWQ